MARVSTAGRRLQRSGTPPASEVRRRRHRLTSRPFILLLGALYFGMPMLAAFLFTVLVPGDGPNSGWDPSAYGRIASADGIGASLALSFGLAVAAIVIVLALTLPAMIAVRLAAPRLRPVLEVLCTLPLVVPPITFVAGIKRTLTWQEPLSATPLYSTFNVVQQPSFPLVLVIAYVVLALPFVYRALDAGLRTIDVRTLVEAARNLGASWPQVVIGVLMPNLRSALAGACFLTLALVLGEYTVAALLNYQTYPVWIVWNAGVDPQLSVAVSLFSLALTWALLLALSTAGARRKESK
ncbi:ABC transporter permease subunit [Nocardia uniformis]|uniref:ABC transporter permease subunit n=1 Tax=Nocardia uniformis TaxID=53432 RepID=A0A849BQL4_9NOCA|nr:ABC transporter permease subunit [Nocardia uniformis]NNH68893.1 ABC transporter permease subunit [Nocardia uniformis]